MRSTRTTPNGSLVAILVVRVQLPGEFLGVGLSERGIGGIEQRACAPCAACDRGPKVYCFVADDFSSPRLHVAVCEKATPGDPQMEHRSHEAGNLADEQLSGRALRGCCSTVYEARVAFESGHSEECDPTHRQPCPLVR
uniref:Uncharacterized protein n=1 Tax=Eutreptiella gymnastica TaxID=73025 RepID=A0A7S4FW55_9EUGL